MTDEGVAEDELRAELAGIYAEVETHPALRVIQQGEELDRARLWLERNAEDFRSLLDHLNQNPGVGHVIMAESPVPFAETPARAFLVEAGRLWLNFLASAQTLVDHIRAVANSQTKEFRAECEAQRRVLIGDETVKDFTTKARNHLSHVGILNFTVTWKFTTRKGRQTDHFDVSLATDMLLSRSRDWSTNARLYIESHAPKINLGESVTEYLGVSDRYFTWFRARFYEEHFADVQEGERLMKRGGEIRRQLSGDDGPHESLSMPTPRQMRSVRKPKRRGKSTKKRR